MASRPDLTAFLVAQKIATAREVDRVGRTRGEGPLWSALLGAGVVDAGRLFSTLRDQSKVPVATDKQLANAGAAADSLSKHLGKEDALRLGLLPLELSADGRRVQVGMVDPTDEATLRELARAAGFQSAKVFLVERTSLEAAIERAYAPRRSREARATVEPAAKIGQRSELEAAERLERVLVQASLGLAAVLESELIQGQPQRATATEAARLAREVARELGHDRRKVSLVGLAALLVQLDRVRRARRGDDEHGLLDQVSAEIGWAGGGDDGLLAIARALTAQAAGFGRGASSRSTKGGGSLQHVVQVVSDYLALGSDGESIDIEAAGQLLRASSAGPEVVAALVRVVSRELAERTPAMATPFSDAGEPLTQLRNALPRPEASASDRTQVVPIPKHSRSTDPSAEG